MKIEPMPTSGIILPLYERRESPPPRVLGNLVSLNGMRAVVASRLTPGNDGVLRRVNKST
jgi:hypothetical protein